MSVQQSSSITLSEPMPLALVSPSLSVPLLDATQVKLAEFLFNIVSQSLSPKNRDKNLIRHINGCSFLFSYIWFSLFPFSLFLPLFTHSQTIFPFLPFPSLSLFSFLFLTFSLVLDHSLPSFLSLPLSFLPSFSFSNTFFLYLPLSHFLFLFLVLNFFLFFLFLLLLFFLFLFLTIAQTLLAEPIMSFLPD